MTRYGIHSAIAHWAMDQAPFDYVPPRTPYNVCWGDIPARMVVLPWGPHNDCQMLVHLWPDEPKSVEVLTWVSRRGGRFTVCDIYGGNLKLPLTRRGAVEALLQDNPRS